MGESTVGRHVRPDHPAAAALQHRGLVRARAEAPAIVAAERLRWADSLKLAAICGVIVLHVSAPALVPFQETPRWWVGNLYDSLTRWCVPLFVMVSGALVLPSADKLPIARFLATRVRKILLPFVAWSAIYFLYRIHVKGHALAYPAFFEALLAEPVYYHLWFVYMLLALYLFAPVMSALLNNALRSHVWYLIALWFLWASVLPLVDWPLRFSLYYMPDLDDYSPLKLGGFFLLGHAMRHWRIRSAGALVLLAAIFAAGAAATILGTYFTSRAAGEFQPFFYKYFSATVVAMAVSLFLLIKAAASGQGSAPSGRAKKASGLQLAASSIFGVYLVHALVLELLRDGRLGFTIAHTRFLGIELPLALGIPVFATSIFAVSLGVVLALRAIPVVKHLLT